MPARASGAALALALAACAPPARPAAPPPPPPADFDALAAACGVDPEVDPMEPAPGRAEDVAACRALIERAHAEDPQAPAHLAHADAVAEYGCLSEAIAEGCRWRAVTWLTEYRRREREDPTTAPEALCMIWSYLDLGCELADLEACRILEEGVDDAGRRYPDLWLPRC